MSVGPRSRRGSRSRSRSRSRSPSRTKTRSAAPNTHKSRKLSVADFDKLLEPIPIYLRHGPISPVAPLSIAGVALLIAMEWHYLATTVPVHTTEFDSLRETESVSAWPLHLSHTTGFFYGLGVLLYMRRVVGMWPVVTYTVTSWNLQTARLGLLAWHTPTSVWWAERLRFPCLAGHSLTVLLWWLVLVPIIYCVLPGKHRPKFTMLNCSPLLIHLHVLNIVVTAIDFIVWPRQLTRLDLAIAVSIALAYLAFYIVALDRKGIQIYIILTPRTHFCGLVYVLILLLYGAVFHAWNVFGSYLLLDG